MAESTKQPPIDGGTLISDIKNLFSLLKSRRTVTFAYGFMFAFVLFTVFLAFNPSSNSSSLWFNNIFVINGNNSSRSSVFSYFLPNTTGSLKPNNSVSKNNTTSVDKPNPLRQDTSYTDKPNPVSKNTTFEPNPDFKNTTFEPPPPIKDKPNPNPVVKNTTTESPKPNPDASTGLNSVDSNQTTSSVPVPEPTVKTNQSLNSGKEDKGKDKDRDKDKKAVEKRSNVSEPDFWSKQGIEKWMESMVGCDLFDGEWVMDDSYPLYKPGSCSFIDEQFQCINNGRPDKSFQKLKWKPKGCTLPRLNGLRMLELLRGRRLALVGDSLNRNMWESLVCILKGSVKDQTKVFEAHGRHHFRGEAEYSFVFKDYDLTIEFYVSPFLVQEWEKTDKNGTKKETLRLDLVGHTSEQYKGADILVFNTGHWWTHEKTSTGKDYYQEGSHVYSELNVLEAFRKALTTWSRWVDTNINPAKSLVFFRGYSASHFSGGQWNSGGACDSESEPIRNDTYLTAYPDKMKVLEKVLKGMKTKVTYLNITRLTDYRKDGHPSVYRKQNLSPKELKSPLLFQDCSHWCLPGVPDSWNEILYAEILLKLGSLQQQPQKRP